MKQNQKIEITAYGLNQLTQVGRLASCLISHSLEDLNSSGVHREAAKDWFNHPQVSASSLEVCSQALANLNRYLAANAPSDMQAIPHLAELMPDDRQDPLAWEEKLQAIACLDDTSPEAKSVRLRAAENIELLTDALVDQCREAYSAHNLSMGVGVTYEAAKGINANERSDKDDYDHRPDYPTTMLL